MHTISSQFYKSGQKSMVTTDFATNPSFGPHSQYFKTMNLGMHAPSLELRCNMSQSQEDDQSYQEIQNRKFPTTPLQFRNTEQFLHLKQAVRYLYRIWAANKKIIKKKQNKIEQLKKNVQSKQLCISSQKKIILRKIETTKRLKEKINKRQIKNFYQLASQTIKAQNQLKQLQKLLKLKQMVNAKKQQQLGRYQNQTYYSLTQQVHLQTQNTPLSSDRNLFAMQFANFIAPNSGLRNPTSSNSGKNNDFEYIASMKQIDLMDRKGSKKSIGQQRVLKRQASSKSWIPDGEDSEVVDMIRQSAISRLGGTNKNMKKENEILQMEQRQDSSEPGNSKMKTLHQSSINIDTKTDNLASISSPKRPGSDRLEQYKSPLDSRRRTDNKNKSQEYLNVKNPISQARKVAEIQQISSKPSSRILQLPNVLGDLRISQAQSKQHQQSNQDKQDEELDNKQKNMKHKSEVRSKKISSQANNLKISCVNIIIDSLDMEEFDPKSQLKKASQITKKQMLVQINQDQIPSIQLSPAHTTKQPPKINNVLEKQDEQQKAQEDDFDDIVLIQQSKIGKREKLISTQNIKININSPQSPLTKRQTTRSDGNASQPSARDSIKTSEILKKDLQEQDDDFFNDISLNRVSRISVHSPGKILQTHRQKQSDEVQFRQTDISKIRNSKSAVITSSNPQKADEDFDEIRVSTGSRFIKKGSGLKTSMLKASKRQISSIKQCDEQQQTQNNIGLPPKPRK